MPMDKANAVFMRRVFLRDDVIYLQHGNIGISLCVLFVEISSNWPLHFFFFLSGSYYSKQPAFGIKMRHQPECAVFG